MRIKNLNELNLEQLSQISGGYYSDASCSCSECSCSCTGDQKDNSIDSQTSNVKIAVKSRLKN